MNRKYVGNSIWGQKTFKNPIKENNLISFIVHLSIRDHKLEKTLRI